MVHPPLYSLQCRNAQASNVVLLFAGDEEDSIDGFMIPQANSKISQSAGGVSDCQYNIRATGSYIGVHQRERMVSFRCCVYSMTRRVMLIGGGKRKGAFAILEPGMPMC
jgi:hypothetical protein